MKFEQETKRQTQPEAGPETGHENSVEVMRAKIKHDLWRSQERLRALLKQKLAARPVQET